MKFSKMPYSRPDLSEIKAQYAELTKRMRAASSFSEAEEAFLAGDKLARNIDTLNTISNIRHDINTEDEFYKAEQEFWDSCSPEITACEQEFSHALFATPWKKEFSEKYSPMLFTVTELELRSFSPEIVPELQRENELSTEYASLIAGVRIPFEGETYTVSQMGPFKQLPDKSRRYEAWRAEGEALKAIAPRLDEIYDELTSLRTSMGRKLGHENYIPMGYDRMLRSCYTRNDIEAFRESVIKYIVPLSDKLYRAQACRLGVAYPMSYADTLLTFPEGNAVPKCSSDEILENGKKLYHELSPETSEFIDKLFQCECMDVLAKNGKSGGGYCTILADYKIPFIFSNFNGTSGDVEVITHEAGHAFQAYSCRDIIPVNLIWPSSESCEIHSMSMEFFAWPWAEGFFKEDADKFRYHHLVNALTFIPYGTMVDHFQHIIYENPELSPDQRNEKWAELTASYLPWIKLTGEGSVPFYSEGRYWQRQLHIYQLPFYYIDYCLAQTVALEFWEYMQRDHDGAWNAYMRLVRPGGTMNFLQLLQAAGMSSPFNRETISRVCASVESWTDSFDMVGKI